MQPNIFKRFYPVILVTLIVLASAALLSVTDACTSDKIAEQEGGKVKGMLKEMFPNMTKSTLENDVHTVFDDGTPIGYGFVATGTGYHGEISILVALDDEAKVKSIVILAQDETPGVGSKITEAAFTSQFEGVMIDDVRLTQDNGKIDGVTGATISSAAVVDAVRNTATEKVKALGK